MKIDIQDHSHLHEVQNVPMNIVRRYREKTNHLLVPDDFVLEEKEKLWKKFFYNIGDNPTGVIQAQLASLYDQQTAPITRKYNDPRQKAEELIESIIDRQRKIIR